MQPLHGWLHRSFQGTSAALPSLQSLKADGSWRKMTDFSRQAVLWQRVRGHPLTSWSWWLDELQHAPARPAFMHLCNYANYYQPVSLVPFSFFFFSLSPLLFLTCSSPSFFVGSVLRHPPAGAVHQGGPRERVPQGGAERTAGQRREGRYHQETGGERRGQAAWTQEVVASQWSGNSCEGSIH